MSEKHEFTTSMTAKDLAHFGELLRELDCHGLVPVFYRERGTNRIIFRAMPRTECQLVQTEDGKTKWRHIGAPTITPSTRESLGGTATLSPADLEALGAATGRIYKLMRDGRWYTREEIVRAAGQLEGTRRMRELRRWFDIQRRRQGESRLWEYRLHKRAA